MPIRQNNSALHADDAKIEQYSDLLDHLNIGLLVFSADASVHRSNAQAKVLLGEQPLALAWVGENDQPLKPGERPQIVALETAAPLLGRIVGLSRSDGSTAWLKADALPVFAEDNSVRRVLLTLTDISEQKSLKGRIEQLTVRDPLTGVFNERQVMHLLENEISRARRYGTPFALAQLDIDLFLPVCEAHGQSIGDDALASVGKLLLDCMREIDIAGRIGNDEFLLVLPNVSLQDALIALERLRGAIETQVFTSAGLKLTISGGITEYTGENSKALIERSKSLLLHAREAGRNRFCFDADIF